jgi:hypothetical protein
MPPITFSWTIDIQPPTTTLSEAPPTSTNATDARFAFTSESGAAFECRLDAGAWAPCESPKDYGSLLEGPHSFFVRASDVVGNVESPAIAHDWTIDRVTPQTSLTGPANPVSEATAVFGFSANETATSYCRLNGAAWAACTSPWNSTP